MGLISRVSSRTYRDFHWLMSSNKKLLEKSLQQSEEKFLNASKIHENLLKSRFSHLIDLKKFNFQEDKEEIHENSQTEDATLSTPAIVLSEQRVSIFPTVGIPTVGSSIVSTESGTIATHTTRYTNASRISKQLGLNYVYGQN